MDRWLVVRDGDRVTITDSAGRQCWWGTINEALVEIARCRVDEVLHLQTIERLTAELRKATEGHRA